MYYAYAYYRETLRSRMYMTFHHFMHKQNIRCRYKHILHFRQRNSRQIIQIFHISIVVFIIFFLLSQKRTYGKSVFQLVVYFDVRRSTTVY